MIKTVELDEEKPCMRMIYNYGLCRKPATKALLGHQNAKQPICDRCLEIKKANEPGSRKKHV